MNVCVLCGKEVQTDKYFSRKSACPKCGGDLHICLNCKFYSEKSHNKCIETKAEFQRSRDRANFCDYFSFRETATVSSAGEKEEALKKLEDLFKNF
jgi:hypothetical protein